MEKGIATNRILLPRNRTDLNKKKRRKRRARDILLGTWNVLSWYRPGIATRAIKQLEELEFDVTAIQEMRWTGSGTIHMEKSLVLWSGHETKHEKGCGFVITEKLKSALLDFIPVNERICSIRIKGKWFNLTIFSVYAPTEEASEDDKDEFYDTLNQLYASAPHHDIKIILGDLNAKIGKEEHVRSIAGIHSLHVTTNDNGTRLIDFATGYNLIVKSTQFDRKNIHKATWRSNDGRTNNQIDHVLIDGRHSSSIINVRTMRGPDSDTDHYLVKAKLRTRISTQTTNKQTMTERWDVAKLEERERESQYQTELNNRFQMLDDSDSENIDQKWHTIKRTITEVAEKCIGKKKKVKSKKWFDEECDRVLKEANKKRMDYLSSPSDEKREQFNRERAAARITLRQKKRQYLQQQIEKVEEEHRQYRNKTFYREVRQHKRGSYLRTPNFVRSKNEEMLTAENKVIERWAEYFGELLNIPSGIDENYVGNEYQTAEIEIPPPSIEETRKAIKTLKNDKSPGIDNIDAELIKKGGQELEHKIHQIIQMAWEREIMPKEWGGSIIVPIHKKGKKDACENYRGISLIGTIYKILATLVQKRLLPYTEEIIGDYQCGFRPGRSTIDQIFTIRQMLEKYWEYNRDVHQIFIDFKQAYDSVNRKKLWDAMVELGVPGKLVAVTKMCVNNSFAQVRIGGKTSNAFSINSGLRQGDPLSPLLFNLALEYAMRKIYPKIMPDIAARGAKIVLAFADDVDTAAESAWDVKDIFSHFEEAALAIGLQVNEDKTKYMIVSKRERQRIRQNVTIKEHNFEVVKEFKYLGTTITNDNKIEREVEVRLLAGSRSFFAIQHLMRSKLLSRRSKIKIYESIIRPVVTYGSETWTLTKSQINKLLVWERKILRVIYGPCKDNITNEWRRRHNNEIETLFGKQNIVRYIKANRLRWAGHVIRSGDDRLINNVYWERPDGRRSVGRPRQRWKDAVRGDLERIGVRQWEMVAQDRQEWRAIVNAAKTHEEL